MNADTEQELFTRFSWSNPQDSLSQMDFIMTSRQLEMKHVQVLDSDWFSLFDETENEINDEEWCEPAWLGARRIVAQSGCRDADGMGELERDGAFACGTGEVTQENGNQRDVSDRTRAQITPVEKEESRATTRKVRAELALSRQMEKKTSLETREASGKDQGECRDGKSPQENAKQAFQLDLECKTRKPRVCSHKLLPKPLLNSGRPGGSNLIRERILGRFVEKLENGLCRRHADFTKET